jgi:endogenous inhibitor of DNA gyrase (YacG/DUF329 family)
MSYTPHIPPDLPTCPECQMPMRLTRIVPSMVPKKDEPQIQTFECARCQTRVTRTVRPS